ncbi:MAG: protein-disulfide reductase DsbD domain-containing protein [Bacteroidota bacterium]
MLRLLYLLPILFFTLSIYAQSASKVSWKYSAKKLEADQYEIRLSATIQPGWHLYSQNQTKDAIALPTTIQFNKNPLATLSGKIKEVGKLYDEVEKATKTRSRFYKETVDFVQVVTLKGQAKTAITGEIEFMVCDDKQCLPPETVKFSVKL